MGDNMLSLSGSDEIVLLAVMRLGPNAYGVTIRKAVTEATGQEPSIGAIYTALERLEEKGFVSSRQGEPTPERGGRAKRYFEITGAGAQALTEAERVRALLRGQLRPAGGAV